MFGGSGLGSMLATGMAFGAGSAVAHHAVRGLTGGGGPGQTMGQQGQMEPGLSQPVQYNAEPYEQAQNKCQLENDEFIEVRILFL